MSGGMDRPVYWESPVGGHRDYRSPRPPSQTYASWPVMQPFRALVALVKRCPWAVGSGLGSQDQALSDDAYYPSVPRSLFHDTAVSFVVKDHTRPDLPEFVISCPFEHVDMVHQLLAPEGSRRQLSARGTSGQPRAGDQLRSMLLDGTPSIELTLHPYTGRGRGGRSERQKTPEWNDGAAPASRPGSGGGWGNARRNNWADKDDGGWHTLPVAETAGIPESPSTDHPDSVPTADEPDATHPMTQDVPALPLSRPQTPPGHSPLPQISKQEGQRSHVVGVPLQATVETAPPSPATQPSRLGQDEPVAAAAAAAAEQKLEKSQDDKKKEKRGGEQARSADVREPPTLCYMQPTPEQIQRGEPLRGWLCEPEWFRRRIRDLTQKKP
ncbi:hypothetical protein diail_12127 [Diaporthe ilicicola]|nr:hypothetical protein diail_12127 [Diaporthe ilicicola]